MKTLRIGTRGSDLALWQANYISARLEALGDIRCERVIVKTSGDRIQDVPLTPELGKGFFTKEIEEGLLERKFDLAVHSLKDLAVTLAPGLVLAAVPERGPIGERLLISPEAFDKEKSTKGELPLVDEAKVGTSSLRRRRRLLDLRPDLQILDLRGNVPTRVKKLQDGNYDAILIAQAGLERLALETEGIIAYDISPRLFPGAPGQGALGLEAREGDTQTLEILKKLEDPNTRALTDIERGILEALGGGCSLPLGTLASLAHHHGKPIGYRLDAFAYGRDDHDPGISLILTERDTHSLIQQASRLLAPALDKPLAGKVLHLIGGSGKSLLTSELQAAGATTHFHKVFEIEPLPIPKETWEKCAQLDALLFSSQSALDQAAPYLHSALTPHSSQGDTLPFLPTLIVPGRASRQRAEALFPEFHVLEAKEKNSHGMAVLAIQEGCKKIAVFGAQDGSTEAIKTATEAKLQVLHIPLYRAISQTPTHFPKTTDQPKGDTLYLSPKAAKILPPQGVPGQVLAIGKATSNTLRDLGRRPDQVLEAPDLPSLIDALNQGASKPTIHE
jgi:hydroxymethylbilane synthase